MADFDSKAVLWPGWETVCLIGRGSFGAVYEIRRDVLGNTEKAAVKLITIPEDHSEIEMLFDEGYDEASVRRTFQEYLKRIVDEYSLMRKLNGSVNVVNCDDVHYEQHEDGFGWDIFIKMELLTPLTKALGKEIPDSQVIRIGTDICKALALCKKHNIVHRDIKPANIFVSDNGDYKLGDFGIAKTVERTRGGTKIGTYDYMAPEVFNNQPYGTGADIYSLGMVLYWLLNDKRMPFLSLPPATPSVAEKEQARSRRFCGEAIPAPAHGSSALQRVVLKALAFDPQDRYQNAEDILRDLEMLNQPNDARTSHGHANNPAHKETSAKPKKRTLPTFLIICIAVAALALRFWLLPKVDENAVETDDSVSRNEETLIEPSSLAKDAAAEEPEQWIEGDWDWSLEDGTLFITGTGNMANYLASGEQPWGEKNDQITSVVIEKGITSIGDFAFEGCSNLTGIEIPDSVTTIGDSAFFACHGLTSIEIPNSVITIENSAFRYCINLASISIPDGVTSIGDEAFCDCTCLTDVYYSGTEAQWNNVFVGTENDPLLEAVIHFGEAAPKETAWVEGDWDWSLENGVLTISGSGLVEFNKAPWDSQREEIVRIVVEDGISGVGDWAFDNCSNMTDIELPDSMTTIGEGAFYNCTSLTSIRIPPDVTIIEWMAFGGCESLSSIEIPSSVTTIESLAFSECENLTSFTIPSNVTSIGSNVFSACVNLSQIEVDRENSTYCSIEGVLFSKGGRELLCYPAGKIGNNYRIAENVTEIGDFAFACCTGLTRIEIPESVTNIGEAAFNACTGLVSITIPNSVTSINRGTFYSCPSLTRIELPDGVKRIGESAFEYCDNLTDVYFSGTEAQWKGIFFEEGNDPLQNATIHFNDTEDKSAALKRANIGDIVCFGAYEQDNDTTNGAEDIEWIVLAKEENRILVISKYALDSMPYNSKYIGVTWETCTLRTWLNGDFLEEAFSTEERAMIPLRPVKADKNPSFRTSPGNNTMDKVFLLSVIEANRYFSSDSARQCQATSYAKAQGAHMNPSNGNCWWWLRSPGCNSISAAGVSFGGSVGAYGNGVDRGDDAVRPALWIGFGS